MKSEEASKTAEFNALFRAIESSRKPKQSRLFNDPYSYSFLGRLRYAYFISLLPFMGWIIPFYIDKKWPGVRASALGRTCWIDDQLCTALREGIDQVVILGSGYDCRAYRIPGIERARVFELDHPDTLNEKIKRLKHLSVSIRDNVTMIEVNFSRQDFANLLEKAGFKREARSFFIWEGVMHYLSADAVDITLRSISSLSALGSKLVFTYIHRGLLDGKVIFGDMGYVPSTLQKSGETWIFGLYPEELSDYLAKRGFILITDIGSAVYRSRYLGSHGRHMKGFEFYRAALAEVGKADS